ncbi:hypothetical protein JTB14_007694 [Gonioctena quinquepunctata]|nr:hypothetical protein JTB14_007694 [Gonioctena quinquepunctata]
MVRVMENENPEETLGKIKGTLTRNETQGGLRGIRKLASGAVIIEAKTKEQSELIQQKLKENITIQSNKIDNVDPMLLLTGVEEGIDPMEIIDMNTKENIKVIHKRLCRNPR